MVRCKWFAYGPTDATASPSSLASLKSLNPTQSVNQAGFVKIQIGLAILVPA